MVAATESTAQTHDRSIPDAAVVSLVDAVSHALDSGSGALPSVDTIQKKVAPPPVPAPLPPGWVMKQSRSQPGYFYYYHQETSIATWQAPMVEPPPQEPETSESTPAVMENGATGAQSSTAITDNAKNQASKKRPLEGGESESTSPSKKPKRASDKPSKVRVLHILKKHKDSRRPSSWRMPVISASKEEAREELMGLLEILSEESGEERRATFEELARTESDCSSAKRGGDLGFFGPRKMQPAFEEASFALEIGEMSGIVETSSGVHVLLRVG